MLVLSCWIFRVSVLVGVALGLLVYAQFFFLSRSCENLLCSLLQFTASRLAMRIQTQ